MLFTVGEQLIAKGVKDKWVMHTGSPETGMNNSDFELLVNINDELGVKVIVLFHHEGEGAGVYYLPLDDLKEDVRLWDGKVGGMRVERSLALFRKSLLQKRL